MDDADLNLQGLTDEKKRIKQFMGTFNSYLPSQSH